MNDYFKYFKYNYQRVSDNRFVIDSDRFWREEWHPRFANIFTVEDFLKVLNSVIDTIPNPFNIIQEYRNILATNLFNCFAGYRFAFIPAKNKYATQQFLSHLYFVLQDILRPLLIKDFPITADDFNVVTHTAETGKNDSTKLATGENMSDNSKIETRHDILSEGVLMQENGNVVENSDREAWQNSKKVNDIFVSPQNQGVKPTTVNTQFEGVDGININDDSSYTTTTDKENFGESNKEQNNVSSQTNQAHEELKQNNDIRTTQNKDDNLFMEQSQEYATMKNDNYIETLDFDRAKKLTEFFDLNNERLWLEIINRLSQWVLTVTIATSDYNYNDCIWYD